MPESADNFNFTFGNEDWRRLLREYPTDMVLAVKLNPVARLMEKEAGWTMVYQDEISVLYLPTARSGGPWRYPPKADGSIP